jgi:hypothetical protein
MVRKRGYFVVKIDSYKNEYGCTMFSLSLKSTATTYAQLPPSVPQNVERC